MKSRKSAILGDDMGIGKTVQAIKAVEETGSFPLLVVCPKTVKQSWKAEFSKWSPNRIVAIVDGPKAKRSMQIRSGADAVLVNYEQLRIDELELLKAKFGAVVFDEAHRIKNRKSKVFKSACHLKDRFPNARFYFLTGTPIRNRAQEIWTMLHLIDKSRYRSYWKWIDQNFHSHDERYGRVTVRKIDGPRDYEKFKNSISEFMLRRKRGAVLDLPPLTETVYEIDLEPKHRKIYNSMRDNMVARLENGTTVPAPVVIAQITRLKQICCSPSIIEPPYGCDGAKWDAVLDLIDSAQSQKLVIYSQFSTYLEAMHSHLSKEGFGIITGKTPMDERISLVEEFQKEDGNLRGMLVSIKAGGEGITLVSASIAVFTDLVWTPADIDQAIARIHRNGQTRPSTVYFIRAKDTVESKIDGMIRSKRLLIERSMPAGEVRKLLES